MKKTTRFKEFKNKEIINISDGMKIGYVDDILFDSDTAQIESIVVYGRLRWFGILGRENDLFIPWENVEIIGDDTILVKAEPQIVIKKPSKIAALEKLFS